MTDTEALSPELKRQQHEAIGERVLAETRAFGKLILFGEHFVVYKVPALVGAVAAWRLSTTVLRFPNIKQKRPTRHKRLCN